MSAKSIVMDEYPQATAIKDDKPISKFKTWSIMVDEKSIGIGRTENSAWRDAKSHVLKKVMNRVFEKM